MLHISYLCDIMLKLAGKLDGAKKRKETESGRTTFKATLEEWNLPCILILIKLYDCSV